ncbi:MAG: homoserine kinase [Acidobacteriia bacterium]|nr:homoserine kinase [Terriglobia bacterium]
MNRSSKNFHFAIRVPASTSNLGPGFDVFGLALGLYLGIEARPSGTGSHQLEITGADAADLQNQKRNLILEVARKTAAAHHFKLPGLHLKIHSDIPLARGLGSSAAAIIGGISIAECFSRRSFSTSEIFRMALNFEAHPDNLAACLLGGFTAAQVDLRRSAWVRRLPLDRHLRVIVAIPELRISTHLARQVLPPTYPRADVVSNLQNAVLLSHALGEVSHFESRHLFSDRLHQPYRARLLPGLTEAIQLPKMAGLVGVFLSGSGSTLAALATSNFESIGRRLQKCFSNHGLSSKMQVLSIDRKGRRTRRLKPR